MERKGLVALALVVFAAGGVFAEGSFWGSPKNAVTVDFGPTLVGMFIDGIGDLAGAEEGLNTSGFGIGIQYERHLFEPLAVAGRFAYLGGGLGISEKEEVDGVLTQATLGMKDIRRKMPDVEMADNFAATTDDVFAYLEDVVFIGGPRLTLAFGWRF